MPRVFASTVGVLFATCALLGVACGGANETTGGGAPAAPGPTGEGSKDVGASSANATDAAAAPDAGGSSEGGGPGPAPGPSSGCGKAGAATGLQARTLMLGTTERSYLRSVPASYDPSKPLALVIGLHGTGDDDGTPAKARTQYGVEAKAAGNAIFVYPEALASTAPAYLGEHRWDPDKPSEDFAFITSLLTEVEDAYCVDRGRVFAVGFSNGGRMTAMLGCYLGDVLRAVAPVAPGGNPGTPPISGCVGSVAVWGGRGSDDAMHEPGTALVLDYYPTANGCAATRTPTVPSGCQAYDGCRSDAQLVWCTYPGGHAWPSFGAAGIWGFFSTFTP